MFYLILFLIIKSLKNRYDRFFLVVFVCLIFKEKVEEFLFVYVNIDLLSVGRLLMFFLMRYRGREFWVII